MAFNPLAAVADGYNFAQGLRDQQAQRQAGNLLASGDTQGAQNALYGAGMIDQGNALADRQQRQAATELDTRYRQAQIDNLGADNQRAEAKQKLEWMGDAAQGLRRVPMEQRKAALQQYIMPTLQAMGLPQEALQQLAGANLTDEELDAFAQAMGAEAEKLTFYNTSLGIVAVDPRGNARMAYETPPAPPTPPQGYRYRADGSTLEAIPGGPADPKTAGALSASRRAPRAGGGSAGVPPLPPGFVLEK